MTALIVANSIAAVFVVAGLVAVARLGHLTAGGRFERVLRRFEVHHGRGERPRSTVRRAA